MTPIAPPAVYALYALLGLAAIALAHRSRSHPRRAATIALAAIGLSAAVLLVTQSRGRPFRDFDKAYYPAGNAIFSAPGSLYACTDDTLCFVNLPIVALQFTPFSVLPLAAAHLLFTAFGIAAAAAAYVLLARDLPRGWPRAVLLLLFVFSGPLWYSVRLGNMTHVVLLMLVGAVSCLARGRDRAAGVLLAMSILNKPPLALLAVWLLLRRRWEAVLVLIGTVGGALVASLLLFGVAPHLEWVQRFVQGFGSDPMAAYNAQSVVSMVARLAVSGWLYQWQAIDVPAWADALSQIVVLLLTITTVAACAGHRLPLGERETKLEFSLMITLAILAAPISWTHYYLWLLIPSSLWVAALIEGPSPRRWRAAGLAVVLVSLPVIIWIPARLDILALMMERLLVSHYVIGGIIALIVLARRG